MAPFVQLREAKHSPNLIHIPSPASHDLRIWLDYTTFDDPLRLAAIGVLLFQPTFMNIPPQYINYMIFSPLIIWLCLDGKSACVAAGSFVHDIPESGRAASRKGHSWHAPQEQTQACFSNEQLVLQCNKNSFHTRPILDKRPYLASTNPKMLTPPAL